MAVQEQARTQHNALASWARVSPFAQDSTPSEVLNDRTIPFQDEDDILSRSMSDCGSRIANGLYNRPIWPLIKPIKSSHIICTQFEAIYISISLNPAWCVALG